MTFFTDPAGKKELLNPIMLHDSLQFQTLPWIMPMIDVGSKISSTFEGKPIKFYREKVHFLQYFQEPISEHIAGYLLIKFSCHFILCIIMNDILYLIVKKDFFVTLYIRLYRLHINNDSWRNTALIFLFDRFQEKMIFIPIYTISASSPP